MLSDSLHESAELIWDAVKNYDYSEEFKDEIINALTEITYIVYKLDRLEKDCKWSKEDMKQHVLKRWTKLNCLEAD